jgi:hypothetical protein
LVVTAASKAPKSVVAGSRIKVRVAVANRAGGEAGRSLVGLYLSTNARWSSSDVELAGSGRTRGLTARHRVPVTFKVRVPRDAPPAERFKLLACADARHLISEKDERNNCRAAGSLVVVGGSSFEVIDAYVRLGRLKASRALLYKLFAVVGDRRLPKRYRGDGSRLSGTSVVRAARERLPSLPPAIRAQVRPFLIPPAYQGSFADKSRASTAQEPDPCAGPLSGWSSVVTDNGGARVWWRSSSADAADAQRLKRELGATIWTSLTAVMAGRQPQPDGGYPCGGPDSKLDVYLWPTGDPDSAFTQPLESCETASPAYIVVHPRAHPGVLAHEFMHVLQETYPRAGDCGKWEYLDDATATWAEDRAYHHDQTEHVYPHMVGFPHVGLRYESSFRYDAWAFVFSATQHAGDSATVRRLYELGAGIADPIDALDAALPRGLESAWPAFAKDAWNRPLLPDGLKESFFNWDAWRVKPRVRPLVYRLKGRQLEDRLPIELAGLTRQYYDLRFGDRRARRITFKDPSGAGADSQLHTWAFVKVRRAWRAEDWTGRREVEFCRDNKAEDVRQVVIVHSTTRRPRAGHPGRIVTHSDKPRLKLESRCEAGASLTLGGSALYTVTGQRCGLEERARIPSWRLRAEFELPGRIERGAPDPVDASSGSGSGSLELEQALCDEPEHSTHPLSWEEPPGQDVDTGLTLRLLRRGGGLEVEVRMGHFGFALDGESGSGDVTPFGLGLTVEEFERGGCKEIHGMIPASRLDDRSITVPVSGTCNSTTGADPVVHGESQANGTLVITQ